MSWLCFVFFLEDDKWIAKILLTTPCDWPVVASRSAFVGIELGILHVKYSPGTKEHGKTLQKFNKRCLTVKAYQVRYYMSEKRSDYWLNFAESSRLNYSIVCLIDDRTRATRNVCAREDIPRATYLRCIRTLLALGVGRVEQTLQFT